MATKKGKRRSPLRWIIILGAVFLIVLAYIFFSGGDDTLRVTIEEVENRTVVASVTESGVIEPVVEVAIAADVSGEVVTLKGVEGEWVEQGDLLVTIRPDNYESALDQARAALNGAQANALQAAAAVEAARSRKIQDSATYARIDRLYKNGVVSAQEWENARLARMVSQSDLQSAIAAKQAANFQVSSSRATVGQARNNLQRTNIYATMSGTLTRMNVKEGERVVGTVQMAGTEVLRIADLSEMRVAVEVNENDIRFLRIGDSAHIEIDAFGDRIFKGQVTEMAYSPAGGDDLMSAASSDQITNYEVKVRINRNSYAKDDNLMRDLPKYQSPFRPGMSATVEIFTDRVENVVAVPIQAVTIRRPDTDDELAEPEEVVFAYENGQVSKLKVNTGINDDKYIVVDSGLTAGAQIVTGPYRALSKELDDAMKVRPTAEKEDGEDAEE